MAAKMDIPNVNTAALLDKVYKDRELMALRV